MRRVPARPEGLVSAVSAVVLAVVAVAFIAASPPESAAAARVTGIVRTSLRPLGGVHVALPAVGASAVSDSAGRFALAGVPAGVHDLVLAAVGYVPFRASVVVGARADSAGASVDAGAFRLEPLRPDETPIGFAAGGAPVPAKAAAPVPNALPDDPNQRVPIGGIAPMVPAFGDTALPPVAPQIGFYRTEDEQTRWPARPELRPASQGPNGTAQEFADLLRRVAVADSITRATAGTGAPGFETWRQWGDRFAVFAGDSARAVEPALERDSALVVRAVAYARTRAALAAGPTNTGYRLAGQARDALARAGRAGRGDAAAFLSHLGGEVDRMFPPGSSPPPPPKAPAKKKKKSTRKKR